MLKWYWFCWRSLSAAFYAYNKWFARLSVACYWQQLPKKLQLAYHRITVSVTHAQCEIIITRQKALYSVGVAIKKIKFYSFCWLSSPSVANVL